MNLQFATVLLLQPAQLNQQRDTGTVAVIDRRRVEIHRRRPCRGHQPRRFAPNAPGAVGVEPAGDGELEQSVARAVAAQAGGSGKL